MVAAPDALRCLQCTKKMLGRAPVSMRDCIPEKYRFCMFNHPDAHSGTEPIVTLRGPTRMSKLSLQEEDDTPWNDPGATCETTLNQSAPGFKNQVSIVKNDVNMHIGGDYHVVYECITGNLKKSYVTRTVIIKAYNCKLKRSDTVSLLC